jgi:hypothetical protein
MPKILVSRRRRENHIGICRRSSFWGFCRNQDRRRELMGCRGCFRRHSPNRHPASAPVVDHEEIANSIPYLLGVKSDVA